MTAIWDHRGISAFDSIGKYLIQIFPMGVSGEYQSQPRTKNISVPPASIPGCEKGENMSEKKSIDEKWGDEKRRTEIKSTKTRTLRQEVYR